MIKYSQLKADIAVKVRCGDRHEYIDGSNAIADEILDIIQQHIHIVVEGEFEQGDLVRHTRNRNRIGYMMGIEPDGIWIETGGNDFKIPALDLEALQRSGLPVLTVKGEEDE